MQYTISLLAVTRDLKNNNIDYACVLTEGESLITRGRNTLTKEFLNSNFSHLMFIDGDIGFQEDSVRILLNHNEDIVCGLYPKKHINWDKIKDLAPSSENSFDLELNAADIVWNPVNGVFYDQKKLVEIAHGGTGFMCIHRRVFEKLQPLVKKYFTHFEELADAGWTYEFWKTEIDNGFFLSEDWAFCEMWRKLGGKIYADLSIELSHKGTYEFKGRLVE
ncbi:MAG: hypothetical protein EBV10_10000 [Synechococcaceae bacterium WB6_1A_059]|nr:hypothetical protein [Synechococcaceae bacterium WB6_1A_059]